MAILITYVAHNRYCSVLILTAFMWSTYNALNAGWQSWTAGALSIGGLFIVGYVAWRKAYDTQILYRQHDALNAIGPEFQTSISAIRLAADILATPCGRTTQERTDKNIRIIQEETQRLQQQVDVMLGLAQADDRQWSINLDAVNLHDVIQAVAGRSSSYVALQLNATQPILMADRVHLTNVLHNLLDKALKSGSGEPQLAIQTEGDTTSLTVTVMDLGTGISKHLQRKITKPFYRIRQNNRSSVTGIGLGLSYVQHIVEAHAWQFDVDSTVGEGPAFKIRCPGSFLAPRTKACSFI